MSSIINIAANIIKQRFTSQLSITRPGSKMPINSTNSLRDSMRTEVSNSGIKLIGNKYGSDLNSPTTTRFSFSGAGANPGSNYIHGLVRWLGEKKGIYGRDALTQAFKIARTNAGTSPQNANWINEIKKQVDDEILNLFETSTKSSVQADVKRVLNIKIQ
jgi:hypothetical protein